MEVFNNSRLQLFQDCEKKFFWKYVENLEPSFDGVALPVGTAFHEAVAAMYKGASRVDAEQHALITFWREVPKDWGVRGEKVIKAVKKGEIQLKAMVDQYPWALEQLSDVVAVEKEMDWEVPGTGKVLRFRVDRLIRSNGKLWLHDTKTTGVDVAVISRMHRLRNQYTGYAAAVEAVLGEELAGVMMDFVKKPEVYFKKTVPTEVSSVKEAGFLREPIHKTPAQFEEFVLWFTVMTKAVEEAKNTGVWLKNTDQCFSFNRICPYFELCLRPEWAEARAELFQAREKDYVDDDE